MGRWRVGIRSPATHSLVKMGSGTPGGLGARGARTGPAPETSLGVSAPTTPRHSSGPLPSRRCRGGPQHSAAVRGAPPEHDEDDEQYHQPDNPGRYRG